MGVRIGVGDLPLAPRRMMELELTTLVPLTRMSSSSLILSCTTSSADPRLLASNVSSPSRLARDETIVAPVAFAIRRRSSFLHRRTAIAPASMNSLRHRSSIPLVVRITLAPAARILRTRSSVISDSRLRIASSCSGSSIVMWTPRCMRVFCRFMSRQAILALMTLVFIAAGREWEDIVH